LFTPQKSTTEEALCEQLHAFVDAGLNCTSTEESSIKLPVLSERFSMGASSQYYSFLSSTREVATILGQRFCRSTKSDECLSLALSLSTATYIDIDYDTITRALVINAGWPSPPSEKGWTETISKTSSGTVEVGILNHEPNPDPEDIGFGGFLIVLGQDASPSEPTL
jgi:hypothetical protein